MEHDIYQPPIADVSGQQQLQDAESAEFYIVSIRKFIVLFAVTLGSYKIYWFYRNWSQYRKMHNVSVWPVMRGIFSIFFTHSLFRNVETTLQNKSYQHDWAPGGIATIYVVFSIVENILDRMSMRDIGSPFTDVLSLFMPVVTGYALYVAQCAINRACDDPDGNSNSEFTVANYIWIVIGVALWVMVAFGLFVIIQENN